MIIPKVLHEDLVPSLYICIYTLDFDKMSLISHFIYTQKKARLYCYRNKICTLSLHRRKLDFIAIEIKSVLCLYTEES